LGPITVGLATLAKERFGSASAYGLMISAFALGGLTGSIGAGFKKQRKRGIMLLFIAGSLAILLFVVGLLDSLVSLCAVMFLMGVISGYSNVHMTAWYQERVEPAIMGRVMSLRMFAMFGTMPVSLAVAGFVAESSLKWLFLSSGILMFVVTILAATQAQLREVD
jgi:hypothetical protein